MEQVYLRPMQKIKSGDRVKVNPKVLQDQTRKANHHILRRMIEEDRTGEIIKQGETINHSGWWVRLPYATVLLEPEQVIIQ